MSQRRTDERMKLTKNLIVDRLMATLDETLNTVCRTLCLSSFSFLILILRVPKLSVLF